MLRSCSRLVFPPPRFASFLMVALACLGALEGSARWRPLGPDGAGVVSVIAVDPSDPSILYLGGGSGVYKSVDGGLQWRLAARGLVGRGVYSLAVDPVRPTILYAVNGRGVFKSTDGAASWFPAPANITIEVVRANGILAGTATRQLLAGQRLSQSVPELVPESVGQAGGYIRIRSDQPVIAQVLLGVLDGQGILLFSAVPPAVVSE